MKEEFNLSEKIKQLDEMIELKELNADFSSISERQLIGVYEELKKDIKEFIKRLEEKASNVNKHLGLHNVDECECCEKNWKCVYEILEIIDELAGDKLVEKGK